MLVGGPLNFAPDKVVEGVEVWGVRRSELLGPRQVYVLPAPLLRNLCCRASFSLGSSWTACLMRHGLTPSSRTSCRSDFFGSSWISSWTCWRNADVFIFSGPDSFLRSGLSLLDPRHHQHLAPLAHTSICGTPCSSGPEETRLYPPETFLRAAPDGTQCLNDRL